MAILTGNMINNDAGAIANLKLPWIRKIIFKAVW